MSLEGDEEVPVVVRIDGSLDVLLLCHELGDHVDNIVDFNICTDNPRPNSLCGPCGILFFPRDDVLEEIILDWKTKKEFTIFDFTRLTEF